uniref:ZP domain-containing protein n=1 Tax=Ciona savignyi TaxID=51511 RepID=H2ZH61_CIOSA
MGQDYNGIPVPSCKAIVSGSKYNFRLASQFSACGTRTGRDANGDITVSNRIWFNIGGNALFDMPVPVFTFQCTFQENYNVVASLETMVDDNNKIVQGSHEKTFTGSFQMCKMLSQCPVICPAQFVVQPNGVYTVGEDLNLVIHHTPNIVPSGSTLSVHTLYISCSPDPTSAAVISVISNGCPTNIIPSAVFTSASSTCVTFQVQRLLACNKVYIHASMDVCVTNILQTCTSPSSVRKCPASTRGRRSVDGEEVFGPIYILPHKNKSIKSNGSKDEEISDSKNNFALIPLLGVLVAFVLIASVILIISLFRSYRKDEYTVSSRPTVVGT